MPWRSFVFRWAYLASDTLLSARLQSAMPACACGPIHNDTLRPSWQVPVLSAHWQSAEQARSQKFMWATVLPNPDPNPDPNHLTLRPSLLNHGQSKGQKVSERVGKRVRWLGSGVREGQDHLHVYEFCSASFCLSAMLEVKGHCSLCCPLCRTWSSHSRLAVSRTNKTHSLTSPLTRPDAQ